MTPDVGPNPGSPSIQQADYWWYRARGELLRSVMEPHLGRPGRVLDVGSADGPSVSWLRGRGHRVAMDLDPRGLEPGDVCGSALRLPFGAGTFDVAAAFDVVEHCEPELEALAELYRVLVPGGLLLISVPAYTWAWTSFDDLNHHHRRYTRRRARVAVEAAGFEVVRTTYAFAGTFPFFAAERLRTRLVERGRPPVSAGAGEVPPLPAVGRVVERILLGATALDRRLLPRRDLPFGSSVLVVARRPVDQRDTQPATPDVT
ncbi:class I SAM-dependent methyltransferase [Nocardioides sp. W7]|uniref:class I SAM-dependent methyltransferase n=1 Tax=Nocardioides sp. W7 TaxID=2931390 RepID=UPI001FD2840D|nr:class I SAM-dependent methyltransferase [Nocardioides sp. W7]